MRLAYLSAPTAALLLSSTALMAQDATTSGGAMGAMDFSQSVFVDVEGAAYLIPVDLAAELCGIGAAELTQTAQANLEASGMDPATMQGTGTDTAAAGAAGAAGTTDAGATGAAATDTATADAGAAASTDAGAAETTATDTATADAGGTTGTDAGNVGATGMGSDTATADANAAAGGASDEVQNVETTAADTTAGAGATSGQSFTAAGPEFVELVVCQVDMATATAGGNTFTTAGDAGSTN